MPLKFHRVVFNPFSFPNPTPSTLILGWARNTIEICIGTLAITLRHKERVNTTWSFPVIKWPLANS